ncbi:hypothetical protein [Undibacterium crateris]|uniref:hypothetical protein n=1 Tax=Undibacterium crateris TaxID=2528175 RepID=UPI001389A209|nr:hypothetical protein [Undibacterium crateris]NDI84378.1 hypothetical protein [Undibacterium crateris]
MSRHRKATVRPYDSVDYQYTNNDRDKEKSLVLISNLIGFKPPLEQLRYALNFYAGGTGVDDRLAIRCQFSQADWPSVVQRLRLQHLQEAIGNADWEEELRWFIEAEGKDGALDEHCHRFINSNKHDFQDGASEKWEVFFSHESDVNTWCVVWRTNGCMNYLSFDHG